MAFLAPFLVLSALGLAGVASLIPTLGPALARIRALPNAPDLSDRALVALSLAQPAVLVVVAVAVGVLLAGRVGLRSHLVSIARCEPPPRLSAVTVLSALAAASAGGLLVLVLDAGLHRLAPGSYAPLAPRPAGTVPLVTALLYGGIAEELMLRFGLMTFLVWLGSRLRPRLWARNPDAVVWGAVAFAAVLFGAGHLPALALAGPPDALLSARTVLLNALLGLLFGWLYWRRGLEHAMLAHAWVHGVFRLATPLVVALAPATA